MTRIPLAYPKIPGSAAARIEPCVAFEKIDGTNLHWDWDPQIGWLSFGTRRDSFPLDEKGAAEFHRAHPGLDHAVTIFDETLAGPLEPRFQNRPATVFTEYAGPGSFAGRHKAGDPMSLFLFDAIVGGEMLTPEGFLEAFASMNTARVVFRGKFTGTFADEVREGKFGVDEGVVCKARDGSWTAKIKTHAYRERLKAAFAEDWERHWE